MPRKPRLDAPGALHHIMVRGINKSAIFQDEQDRIRFLEKLGQTIVKGKCTVCAWVLMSNHILFKSGRRGIPFVMQRLLTWYAQNYNRRYNRSGRRAMIGRAVYAWMDRGHVQGEFVKVFLRNKSQWFEITPILPTPYRGAILRSARASTTVATSRPSSLEIRTILAT